MPADLLHSEVSYSEDGKLLDRKSKNLPIIPVRDDQGMSGMLMIYIRLVFCWLICAASHTAYAVSIESTGSQYEPGGVRYFFTVTQWEGKEEGFCNDSAAIRCYLSINGAQRPGDFFYMVSSDHWWAGLYPTSSMYVLKHQMKGFSVPFKGSLFVPDGRRHTDTFCITFAHAFTYSGSRGIEYPIGPCAPVINPSMKCEVKGDGIIDHGELADSAIEGNEAETTLQLTCTGTSSVTVSASKESPDGIKLRADGSLYSKITIEGKPAAAGVPIDVAGGLATPVTIKSQLFSAGSVEPGGFSGSTVLTISPP